MKYPDDFINKIICGDCLEIMKYIPDNSIDTIITDPPYGLAFMGKEWDSFGTDLKKYQEWTRRWAVEALRVAKPGATLLCFGGTRTWHRLACGLEDAGWVIKDTIMWITAQGFPKSLNIAKSLQKKGEVQEAKQWEGYGTALKPAFEPIIFAVKSPEGSYSDNTLKWKVAGLNIDGGRIRTNDIFFRKPTSCKENKIRKTNFNVSKLIGSVTDDWKKGRFPANVILECTCDEIIEKGKIGKNIPRNNEPSKADSKIYGFAKYKNMHKSGAHYQDQIFVHTNPECPCYQLDRQQKNASRFFYCVKASRNERDMGLENLPDKIGGGMKGTEDQTLLTGSGNIRNNKMKNNHPTVKPLKLMEYLCLLTKTPYGGIVLDPFIGSGTTAIAAKNVGRDYIGIELVSEYVEIARERIKGAMPLFS